MFLRISTHFTATRGIPPPSAVLQRCSHKGSSQVEPGDFTSVLHHRLRTLYAQFERKHDMFGYNARPIPGTGRQDHYVYNIWWNGVTDSDVGRFWRNWAVAVGAKIPVELD